MLKRFFVCFLILFVKFPVFAECCVVEHLDIHKKAPSNQVFILNSTRTVKKGNVLEFSFEETFKSQCHKAGDLVNFSLPEALYTCEGTLILPACSKIVAEITRIEKPKFFNKNARVSLVFRKIVFPNNTCVEIKALPFTKDCKLKEGPWTTAGKLLLSTLTLGIVGAGTGVGFAFIPNPAKIGTGLAIGIPIGCTVGLVTGLVTPGVNYKAKQGETIYAVLFDEFSVCEKCNTR